MSPNYEMDIPWLMYIPWNGLKINEESQQEVMLETFVDSTENAKRIFQKILNKLCDDKKAIIRVSLLVEEAHPCQRKLCG